MKLFDSHAHYNDEMFDNDIDEVLSDMKNNNVYKIINVGYNIASSKKAIDISKKYNFVYATCGVSPEEVPEKEEDINKVLEDLENLIKNNNVVAIGEIGLDYHWIKENKEIQKRMFIEQIKLANKYNLPIIIHSRDAEMDTLEILKKVIHPIKNGVFHCCQLNRELVKEALKLGFYISFDGPITFKNSKNANEIINMVALDRIFIEKDSPYLSQEPKRGKRNDSRNIIYIAKKVAEVKKISVEEISKITYKNICKLYGIID